VKKVKREGADEANFGLVISPVPRGHRTRAIGSECQPHQASHIPRVSTKALNLF